MESGSVGIGLMAVLAVTGSVVFIARELHERLLSDFMKKFEFQLSGSSGKCQAKKRVRFADEVMEEPSSNNKEYRTMKHSINLGKLQVKSNDDNHHLDMSNPMPLNSQVLYKGILQYKTLKTHHI